MTALSRSMDTVVRGATDLDRGMHAFHLVLANAATEYKAVDHDAAAKITQTLARFDSPLSPDVPPVASSFHK